MRVILLLVAVGLVASQVSQVGRYVAFDVTTLHHRLKDDSTLVEMGATNRSLVKRCETLEVHLGANARGLTIRQSESYVKVASTDASFPLCDPGSGVCPWTPDNFTVPLVHRPFIIFDGSGPYVLKTHLVPSAVTVIREFYTSLHFNYTITTLNSRTGKHFGILLMDSRNDITRSDLYYFSLYFENVLIYVRIYKCSTATSNSYVTLPGNTPRYCKDYTRYDMKTHFNPMSTLNVKFSISLSQMNSQFSISVLSEERQMISTIWTDTSGTPIKTTRYAIGNLNMEGMVEIFDYKRVLSLDELSGSLTSPPLPPDLEAVCVALVSHSEEDATIDLLLQERNLTTLVGTFDLKKAFKGWSHQHIRANISRPIIQGAERKLVVKASRKNGTSLEIQWVSPCNAEGPEDVIILPAVAELTALDVSQVGHPSGDVTSVGCENGGMKEPGGPCICPPGFTGETCLEGCGANSFGSNCEAVCSERATGCRGLALCRPPLGCNCAPGFKGEHCSTPCDQGEFGNGCVRQCGRCTEGTPCDPFTGICHQGCTDGHYPPSCQYLYSHLREKPVVTAKNFTAVDVSANVDDVVGFGNPQFCQIQYKKSKEVEWQYKTLDNLSSGSTVTGLTPGSEYVFRVVVIDEDSSSYQGDLVPSTVLSMPCFVPTESTYEEQGESNEFSVVAKDQDSFQVQWKVLHSNATWCRPTGYQVFFTSDWRWSIVNVSREDTDLTVSGLLSGQRFTVKVRAITNNGPAGFLHPLVVSTDDGAPGHVRNLVVSSATAHSLTINWDRPRVTRGRIRRYILHYQCAHLRGCPKDCSSSSGKVEIVSNSVVLTDLLPFASYKVGVRALAESWGPMTSTRASTRLAVPTVAPAAASTTVVSRTNTSFTVQWGPPESCVHINGFVKGYRYELYLLGQTVPVLVGTTTGQSATFVDLSPHTEFSVHVSLVNTLGCSEKHHLVLNARTRATTPEVVQNLAVYKRGRRMLGLRWGSPRISYGILESFTITVRVAGADFKAVSVSVKPVPCAPWPHLFCHTVNNLKPDTDYTIAVQARNLEIPEDGEESVVHATTKEGAPTAPSFLRVVNQTHQSFTISWGIPDLLNGQLRSFLVNVEQTDAHNGSHCCQYFPIREVIGKAEGLAYELEITGLKPASRYEVGVTAKTVSLGPAKSTTVHTRPPLPILKVAPKVDGSVIVGEPIEVHVEPADDYPEDLTRAYLLLLMTGGTTDSSPIFDDWLDGELQMALNESFSLVDEVTLPMDLLNDGGIVVTPGQAKAEGVFGMIGTPPLSPNVNYRFVWVLVSEYSQELGVGFVTGESFAVHASRVHRRQALP